MPFCEGCGTRLEPDERFCGSCGAAVEPPASAPPAPVPVAATPPPAAASPAPSVGASKSPFVLIAIAAIVVVGASAFGIYWFKFRDKGTPAAAPPVATSSTPPSVRPDPPPTPTPLPPTPPPPTPTPPVKPPPTPTPLPPTPTPPVPPPPAPADPDAEFLRDADRYFGEIPSDKLDALLEEPIKRLAAIEASGGKTVTLRGTFLPHYDELRNVQFPKLREGLRILSCLAPRDERLRRANDSLIAVFEFTETTFFDLLSAIKSNDDELWIRKTKGLAELESSKKAMKETFATVNRQVKAARDRGVKAAAEPGDAASMREALEDFAKNSGVTEGDRLLQEAGQTMSEADSSVPAKYYDCLREMADTKIRKALHLVRAGRPRAEALRRLHAKYVEAFETFQAGYTDLLLASKANDEALAATSLKTLGEAREKETAADEELKKIVESAGDR